VLSDESIYKRQVKHALLHTVTVDSAITNRILLLQALPPLENKFYSEHDKILRFQNYFHLYHRAAD